MRSSIRMPKNAGDFCRIDERIIYKAEVLLACKTCIVMKIGMLMYEQLKSKNIITEFFLIFECLEIM